MAQESNTGEKTEEATPKRKRDARKRGDVARSRDVSMAIGLVIILLMMQQLLSLAPARLFTLVDGVIGAADAESFVVVLRNLGWDTISLIAMLSALALLPIAFVGLLVEFLQVGPVMTAEKFMPKLSVLNPVEGLKKMFGADNFVELFKSVLQTIGLLIIAWFVIARYLEDFLLLGEAQPLSLATTMLWCSLELFAWTIALFVLVASFDLAWKRQQFAKKLRMSLHDVREERKNDEGDPQLNSARKRLAREWLRDGSKAAAGKASVLVVNPVHLAVAILYDARTTPVPTVIGRGEEELAREMRDAAEDAGVPVLRHELLARALFRDTKDGEFVPRELFNVIAEVTLWAARTRERIERERRGEPTSAAEQALPVPGVDLTRYAGKDAREHSS